MARSILRNLLNRFIKQPKNCAATYCDTFLLILSVENHSNFFPGQFRVFAYGPVYTFFFAKKNFGIDTSILRGEFYKISHTLSAIFNNEALLLRHLESMLIYSRNPFFHIFLFLNFIFVFVFRFFF